MRRILIAVLAAVFSGCGRGRSAPDRPGPHTEAEAQTTGTAKPRPEPAASKPPVWEDDLWPARCIERVRDSFAKGQPRLDAQTIGRINRTRDAFKAVHETDPGKRAVVAEEVARRLGWQDYAAYAGPAGHVQACITNLAKLRDAERLLDRSRKYPEVDSYIRAVLAEVREDVRAKRITEEDVQIVHENWEGIVKSRLYGFGSIDRAPKGSD